ncbi:DUF1302 domain-containing protein [Parvibaculaceae bacterium PLY_AMNH_Bact1]|nr:DUF1302 domain-containing protein [Parvibaculaceae bacterium PLY_AMNH_Bact1]
MHFSLTPAIGGTWRRQTAKQARCLISGSSVLIALGGPAIAYDTKIGPVDVAIDTTISMGVSVRASERDCENVNVNNGGCVTGYGTVASINSDNDNLNFDQWDLTSATVKATHDISAKYANFGAFGRVKYFYDYVYAENDMKFRDLLGDAKEQLDYGVDILDAFVYGDFIVADTVPVTVRVGNQVVNWGESLFLQGGINAFQAVDVTALRTPGAELKEALTPMPMVYSSATYGDTSVEAFWQWDWEKTEIDPSGSFFAGLDISGRGPNPGILGSPDDLTLGNNQFDGIAYLQVEGDTVDEDSAEFGAALRHYAEGINGGTEFGLYYSHYTSRLPFLGYQAGTIDAATACAAIGGCIDATTSQLALLNASDASKIEWVYPDSINTIGASASTTIGDIAFAMEASFTPDMPLQTESNQQLAQMLDAGGFSALFSGSLEPTTSDLAAILAGQSTTAITESDTLQGQFNTISTYTQSNQFVETIGADLVVLLFNGGFMYVPDAGDLYLNHGGSEIGINSATAAAILSNGVTNTQYATSFSTGYRVSAINTYNNPWDLPVTVTPSISFRHDTTGFAPGPIGPGFVKGVKQVSLALGVSYLNAWNGSVSYTNGFGGGVHNGTADKDFISASLSYSF